MTVGTIAVCRAAIGRAHIDASLPDPTQDPAVAKLITTSIRATRTEAGETENRAPAVSLEDLRRAVTAARTTAVTWREQIAVRRDIAVLLLGWANTGRRSELARLCKSDLTLVPHHDGDLRLQVRLRGTKTTRTRSPTGPSAAAAATVPCVLPMVRAAALARSDRRRRHRAGRQRRTHPGRASDLHRIADVVSIAVQELLDNPAEQDPHSHRCGCAWAESEHAAMAVFRPLSRPLGGIPYSPNSITGHGIADHIIVPRFAAVGVAARGHSLRAGRAIRMYYDGASDSEVMAAGGWRSVKTAQRYDRHLEQRSCDARSGLWRSPSCLAWPANVPVNGGSSPAGPRQTVSRASHRCGGRGRVDHREPRPDRDTACPGRRHQRRPPPQPRPPHRPPLPRTRHGGGRAPDPQSSRRHETWSRRAHGRPPRPCRHHPSPAARRRLDRQTVRPPRRGDPAPCRRGRSWRQIATLPQRDVHIDDHAVIIGSLIRRDGREVVPVPLAVLPATGDPATCPVAVCRRWAALLAVAPRPRALVTSPMIAGPGRVCADCPEGRPGNYSNGIIRRIDSAASDRRGCHVSSVIPLE